MALAAALLAVGRAELPAADPQAPARAAALAGQTVTLTGHVADDPRPSGGGVEVLVEPDGICPARGLVGGIGNLMVRWRGPTEVAFGDEVQASGKLTLPRDLPTFDRRAYLAQRHVYLEVAGDHPRCGSHGFGDRRPAPLVALATTRWRSMTP